MSIGNSNIHQVSEIPEITKLPNGRLRVVRRFNKFTREDVDNANLGSLMGDFGDLDTTGEQIVNQGYTNLRLISVEVDNRFNAVTNNSNPVLVKTYETLTNAFVRVTDEDQIEELENGTKRLTRVFRAESGTTYAGDVGTTNAGESNASLILAKSDLKDSGAFAELTLTFLEEDVQLSKSVDNQSPLKTEVQEWFKPGSSRDTKANYSLINKQESNVDGIPTERYTFAKNNVTLFVSEEKVGSQNAVVNEIFKPSNESITGVDTDNTELSGYVEADRTESNYDGIETIRVRFLKPSILSRTDDKSDPACPITIVAFDKDENDSDIFADENTNENAEVDSGDYVLVSKTERDFEGIETFEMRFEKKLYFLQEKENEFGRVENVQVEQGDSSYALQTMPGSATEINGTLNSFIIAQEITEGIVPKRTTTFSTAGVESVSEDLIGSTKVITITSFISSPSTTTASSFSNDSSDSATDFILISDTNNRVNGVDVFTHKYARKNAVISTSEDIVGSQKSFVIEKFGDEAPVDTDVTVDLSGHSVARKEESDVEGIKTFRYTFLQNDVVLSRSRDSIGSQKAVVLEVFNGDNEDTDANSYGAGSSYVLAREEESNVDGVETKRYTYLEPSILSVQENKNTPENRITVRVFDLASNDTSIVQANDSVIVNSSVHILVSQSDEDYEGIKTSVYVFESKDYNTKQTNEFGRTVIDRVEQSEDAFILDDQSISHTVDSVSNLRILSQTIENNDNVVNRKITKYTTVGIDEVREDVVGSQKAIVIRKVGAEPTTTEVASYSDITYDGSSDWSIARKDNSRVAGLDVYTYTFLLDNTVLSVSEDKVGSQEAYIEEIFNPLVTIPGIAISGGSSVAGDYFLSTSQQNGKNKYFTSDGSTYAKILSWSGSQWRIQEHSGTYSTSSDINPNNADDPPETGWSGTGNNLIENMLFRDFDNTLPTSLQFLTTSHRYEKDGYVLAKMDRSNIDGIPTVRYTFLRPSVLSVNKSNNDANGSISVQAFNLNSDNSTIIASTGAIVDSDTHLLVEERVSDFDGIPTKTFTYQKKKFFQKATGDNGLTQITRVEQQASSATDFVIKNGQQGGVTHHSSNDTDTQTDLNGESGTYYLSSQKIDNNNLVEIRTSIFTKGGKLSEDTIPYTISGIETITITSLGAEETLPEGDSIKLFKKEDSDVAGVKKFSRTYIKGVNATSTTTSFTSGKIYQMNATVDFSSVGGPSVGVVGDYFKATSTASVTNGDAYLVSDITNDSTASYKDIVEVQIPGSVAIESSSVTVGGISGSIATTNVTPITRKKVVATVTQQIKTTLDDLTDTNLAYDLRDISCSVNFTSLTEEVGGGTSVTVGTDSNQLTSSGFNRRLTASLKNQFYIGHYLIHDKKTATGTFSYTSNSTPKITGGSLVSNITRTSESKNIITGTGSESQDDSNDSPPATYRTSGTLSINTRPLFTTVDGTVFYEVVKYTV